jgi:hypothetical protein
MQPLFGGSFLYSVKYRYHLIKFTPFPRIMHRVSFVLLEENFAAYARRFKPKNCSPHE